MTPIQSPSTGRSSMELIDIVRLTEEQAFDEAANSKMRVKEVGELHQQKIQELLTGHVDDSQMIVQTSPAADSLIAQAEERHRERMANIAAVPDAYVLKEEGNVVGVQHDDTREIGITAAGLTTDRVALHEAKHREQEIGAQEVELPLTGDPAIDSMRMLSRRALRENGAIKAEGGLQNHTAEYHGYVASSDAIASFLNREGEAGDQLVEEAGDTNAGFDALHTAIVSVAMRHHLQTALQDSRQFLAA